MICEERDWTSAAQHFATLVLEPHSTVEEITQAYCALAKLHHPDSPTSDPEKFKKVQEAYDALVKNPIPLLTRQDAQACLLSPDRKSRSNHDSLRKRKQGEEPRVHFADKLVVASPPLRKVSSPRSHLADASPYRKLSSPRSSKRPRKFSDPPPDSWDDDKHTARMLACHTVSELEYYYDLLMRMRPIQFKMAWEVQTKINEKDHEASVVGPISPARIKPLRFSVSDAWVQQRHQATVAVLAPCSCAETCSCNFATLSSSSSSSFFSSSSSSSPLSSSFNVNSSCPDSLTLASSFSDPILASANNHAIISSNNLMPAALHTDFVDVAPANGYSNGSTKITSTNFAPSDKISTDTPGLEITRIEPSLPVKSSKFRPPPPKRAPPARPMMPKRKPPSRPMLSAVDVLLPNTQPFVTDVFPSHCTVPELEQKVAVAERVLIQYQTEPPSRVPVKTFKKTRKWGFHRRSSAENDKENQVRYLIADENVLGRSDVKATRKKSWHDKLHLPHM